MRNPYQVLGVANGTSKDDCKKAWRKLSRLHHPDNGGDKDLFDEVQKAWQAIESGNVFTDVIKRKSLKHVSLFFFV